MSHLKTNLIFGLMGILAGVTWHLVYEDSTETLETQQRTQKSNSTKIYRENVLKRTETHKNPELSSAKGTDEINTFESFFPETALGSKWLQLSREKGKNFKELKAELLNHPQSESLPIVEAALDKMSSQFESEREKIFDLAFELNISEEDKFNLAQKELKRIVSGQLHYNPLTSNKMLVIVRSIASIKDQTLAEKTLQNLMNESDASFKNEILSNTKALDQNLYLRIKPEDEE